MSKISCNDIEIEYVVYGQRSDPVVLGIQGLSEGWRFWPENLCQEIVSAGFCFIAIDNRDIGGSTIMHEARQVDLAKELKLAASGDSLEVEPPYTLDTLVEDLIGFMDAMSIPSAHILGYSMGGKIAHRAVLAFPDRFASLILLMSSSGAPGLPARDEDAGPVFDAIAQRYDSEDEARERIGKLWDVVMGKAYPGTVAEKTWFINTLIDSGYRPQAIARQLLASYCSSPVWQNLANISCPTTIIHSSDDKVFPIQHGYDLADRIPHARLEVIEGAGHWFPQSLVQKLAKLVLKHLSDSAAA